MEPRSLVAQFSTNADSGPLLCLLLGILGAIGVVDVLINDVFPERFKWKVIKKHRHFVLIALAFCYVASLYVSIFNIRSAALSLFYGWNALSLLSLAFVDAFQRNRNAHAATRLFHS